MMVRAAPDQPLVAVHAVRQANGDLAVMLVNKDPVNSYPVSLHYVGYTPSPATPTVYTWLATVLSTTSTGNQLRANVAQLRSLAGCYPGR